MTPHDNLIDELRHVMESDIGLFAEDYELDKDNGKVSIKLFNEEADVEMIIDTLTESFPLSVHDTFMDKEPTEIILY